MVSLETMVLTELVKGDRKEEEAYGTKQEKMERECEVETKLI